MLVPLFQSIKNGFYRIKLLQLLLDIINNWNQKQLNIFPTQTKNLVYNNVVNTAMNIAFKIMIILQRIDIIGSLKEHYKQLNKQLKMWKKKRKKMQRLKRKKKYIKMWKKKRKVQQCIRGWGWNKRKKKKDSVFSVIKTLLVS